MAQLGLRPRNPSPYYSNEGSRSQNLQDFLEANSNVMANDYQPQAKPEFNYLQQAADADQKTAELAAQSSMNAIHNATPNFINQAPPDYSPVAGPQGQSNPRLQAILRALAGQESGENYGAVNSSSGALGAFQVMPSNIPSWSKAALGHSISTSDFLHSRALQNAIVRYQFNNYLQKYGLKGALSSWYSGSPTLWNNRSPQGDYPSVHDYVMQVLQRLG